MNDAFERYCLSTRAYYRMVKLARTIADVETHENKALNHLQEAVNLRCLDRLAPRRH